ncbi:hypothetical protein Tco_0738766 [Tanacetum coccineum]
MEAYKLTRADGTVSFYGGTESLFKRLDRDDLKILYKLVQERFEDHSLEEKELILWGDLRMMFDPYEQDEIWKYQESWKVLRWRLYENSGVHSVFLIDTPMEINMLVEKKYPLKKEILEKMINLKLQAEEESTMAFELIKFTRSQIEEKHTASTMLVLPEEEVHEKPSDETEVIVQEETPTEIIEEHGSGEKGEMEISTASPPKVTKVSTAEAHVYTRRKAKDKGKDIMEEPVTPKKVKKRTQVQLSMDEELARKMEEEERARFNVEREARALQEEEEERLNLEAAWELQKQLDERQQVPLLNLKELTGMIQNQGGYKESYFKRMSYNDIRPIFERVWDHVNTFIPIGSEVEKGSSKPSKRETSKTVEEEKVEKEDVKPDPEYQLLGRMEITDMEVYKLTRAYGTVSFHGGTESLFKRLDRDDLKVLYRLFQERFGDHSLEEKELILWGDLRMMFDPDEQDEI